MTTTTFSLMNEQLNIDYLTINIQKENLNRVADNLYHLTFNCYFHFKENVNTPRFHKHFQYEANFFTSKYDKNKVSIRFHGENAAKMYTLIKKNHLHQTIFKQSTLSRCDLNKIVSIQNGIKESKEFLEFCYVYIDRQPRNRSLTLDNSGILKICNRKSDQYYRLYVLPNGIKFELEVKRKTLRGFNDSFFNGNFSTFEDLLIKHFYTRWTNLLPYQSNIHSFYLKYNHYIQWLVNSQRKIRKIAPTRDLLVSDYFVHTEYSQESYNTYYLLQFLSYLRVSELTNLTFNGQCLVTSFPLTNFLDFIDISPQNFYQRRRIRKFFEEFEPDFGQDFSFGQLSYNLFKEENCWKVTVQLPESFINYRFPFYFHNFFLTYGNKYDHLVKINLIRCFSTTRLMKVFPLDSLLMKDKIRNDKIKKALLDAFSNMQQNGIIVSKITILRSWFVSNDKSDQFHTSQLTLEMIQRNHIILFYENILVESNSKFRLNPKNKTD